MTRKNFLASSLLTAAGLSLQSAGLAKNNLDTIGARLKTANDAKMKICIFSKQLQWMNYQEMGAAVADMG